MVLRRSRSSLVSCERKVEVRKRKASGVVRRRREIASGGKDGFV